MLASLNPLGCYLVICFIKFDADEVPAKVLASDTGCAAAHCKIKYGFTFVGVGLN